MPLNPEIALGYQPPQVNLNIPSPIQQFGQVLNLRGLMEQQQLRNAQMQNVTSEMQQRQYKMKQVQDFQNLIQRNPDATPSDILGVLGPDGTKVVQETLANRKSDFENRSAHLGRLSNYASTILNDPKGPNDFAYQYNIKQAMDNGDLDPTMGKAMLARSVQDPTVQTALRGFLTNAMDAKAQQDYQFNQTDNQHKLVKAAADAAKAKQDALQAGLQTFGQGISQVKDAAGWADYLSKAPEDVQKFYSGVSWGPRTAGIVSLAASGKPEAGKTFPTPASVVQQTIETAQGTELAKRAAEMQAYQPVINRVMSGDQRLQDLPADIQSKIAPGLIMGGYQGFGKLISDAERERLGDYDRALTVLQNTQKNIQNPDIRSLMGVKGGMISALPWSTAHKDLQSDFITQQQQLKKFITNGSLRGVNADTLNQMFPTLSAQPEHADHQIQSLINTVTAEKQQYLRDLGDKVVPPALSAPAAAAPPAASATGQTPAQAGSAGLPGKVHVRRPDGQTGYINASALPRLLKQNYVQIP